MQSFLTSFSKLFVPLMLFIIVGIYSLFLYENSQLIEGFAVEQKAKAQSLKRHIDQRMHEVVADLEYILTQDNVNHFIESRDALAKLETESIFLGLVRGRSFYRNVSLLDIHGKEFLRVDGVNNAASIADDAELADASKHSYFDQIKGADPGGIQVSFLAPDTAEGDIYDPKNTRLRVSMPFPGASGYLVLTLNEARVFSANEELIQALGVSILVLSQEGFLLYASDQSRSWENIQSGFLKFTNLDDSSISLFTSLDSSQFWRDNELWTYETLSADGFGQWKVVSLSAFSVIGETQQSNKQHYLWLVFICTLLASGLSFLWARSWQKATKLKDDNESFLEQVSETDRLLKLFVTHVPAAVAMVDKDMRYLAVSNRWLEDFRLMNDVVGQSHMDVFPAAPVHWRAVYQRCFEGAVEHCDEEQIKYPDGRVDWIRWEVRPWYTSKNDVGGLVMLMEVITGRKQAAVARDEFVSKVSHELRTPLTAIMGGMKLLQANVFGHLDSQATEILNISERNSQRLLNLVNDLLDMQKIRIGEMEFDFEDVPIKLVVDESLKHVSVAAQEKNIEILISDDTYGVKVHVDDQRLVQVVVNMLLNAIKHSPEGSVVQVEVSRVYKEVMVSVADSGRGVPESLKRQIFDDFAQDEEGDERTPGGTGLGLAIAKSLIEKFGGNISFYNQEEGGAVFYFTLPEALQVSEEKEDKSESVT